jgi:two-component system alkaline phosphatase synthesis response regulator PhoP
MRKRPVPGRNPESNMKTSGAEATAKGARARVLVVDDEEDIRSLVAFNLQAAGMEVLLAESGPEAVNRTRADRPDLVILDLMLPEMDGVSVCEMIRSQPESADIPVIMLTAWATDRARDVGLQAGANEYITKPFSPRELVKRVQMLLAERSLNRRSGPEVNVRRVTIDLEHRRLVADGREIELEADEFHLFILLLDALLKRSGRSSPHPPDN